MPLHRSSRRYCYCAPPVCRCCCFLPNIIPALVALAAGALPAWMVWRSFDPMPANGPIETDNFIFYVGRKGYSGVDKQAGVGWEDKKVFIEALGDDYVVAVYAAGLRFGALSVCL